MLSALSAECARTIQVSGLKASHVTRRCIVCSTKGFVLCRRFIFRSVCPFIELTIVCLELNLDLHFACTLAAFAVMKGVKKTKDHAGTQ
jgi:hypothetical protein